MIKFFSLGMIATAFFLGGRMLAFRAESKAKIVSDIIVLINTVETRLQYSAEPIAQILKSAVGSGAVSGLDFVSECIGKCEDGKNFHEAWCESVESCTKLRSLLGKSTANLLAFGSCLGVTDTQGQISNCRYYKEIFSAELSLRREESRRSAKVFPPLGMLAGVFAVIFLI